MEELIGIRMDRLTFTQDGVFFIWQARPFAYVTVLGHCSGGFPFLAGEKTETFHRGPRLQQRIQDIQETHYFHPVHCVTAATLPGGEFSLTTEGLDLEDTKRTLVDQFPLTHFTAIPARGEFRRIMERDVAVLLDGLWRTCDEASSRMHIPLEDLYGAIRYSHFLEYSGIMQEEEAMKAASAKYNLRI